MVTVYGKTAEQRERQEMRRRHIEAAEAAAARDDAEMGLSPAPARQASNLPELIRGALEAFGRPLAKRLDRMDASIDEVRGEIRRELFKLSTANPGDRDRAARRAAEEAVGRAAMALRDELRRDIVRLTTELEAARREIEALKQERGLRAVK
ncbi:hypothetical protein IB277_06785 [Ensifer sp. ENS07]|uniref:hypothetical protein n=1 Tax=Ensifer sp. ENS07 TaxID=2769274 RepID=UPI001782EFDC|nr:hypothetical protein [Ensifer sp. ENS07]MBD9635998.1 hypothetical protein [Ensifer sp. ENS07]